MEILDFDILLSEEKIKNAIFIPCYDDFGYMAWKSPEIFEIIQEIFHLERLISGVDVWIIERKKEYVLNSEDKIELCELSWYYSNNYRDDLKINQKLHNLIIVNLVSAMPILQGFYLLYCKRKSLAIELQYN